MEYYCVCALTIRMEGSSSVPRYTYSLCYNTSRTVYSMSQWILHTNCTHELQIGLIYTLLACRWERRKKRTKPTEPNQIQLKKETNEKRENVESKREMLDLGNEKNHTAVNKWHFSASKWASCANN